MKTVTFTEFRKNASGLLSAVEQGEVFTIIRHGKPIAEISPASEQKALPAWKKPALRLTVKGQGLSAAILAERANESIL
ncbi:MAG: type II toxin-antitoxin system prevent-host-death family antitoxin [Desulfobacterales bacterium]|nr:MAG: type II toxin-antitoxin system prevent-host-death family antitoxin [Desulfobacterales bacterium]